MPVNFSHFTTIGRIKLRGLNVSRYFVALPCIERKLLRSDGYWQLGRYSWPYCPTSHKCFSDSINDKSDSSSIQRSTANDTKVSTDDNIFSSDIQPLATYNSERIADVIADSSNGHKHSTNHDESIADGKQCMPDALQFTEEMSDVIIPLDEKLSTQIENEVTVAADVHSSVVQNISAAVDELVVNSSDTKQLVTNGDFTSSYKNIPESLDIHENSICDNVVVADDMAKSFNVHQSIEDEETVVNVPIPGTDSLVVMVNDDIVQMVEQNSELMKHRAVSIIRDKRDDASFDDEWRDIPLITYKGLPTYFQFDYRNHETGITESMQGLLRKIEATLADTELEPFGKDRGVETMKRNIENLEEGERYRVKSLSLNKPGAIQPIKRLKLNLNRYALLKLLKERHCIYGVGTHQRLGQLDPVVVGRTFFGPDSDVEVLPKEAEQMLSQLWCFGVCNRFRGLQRRHFAILRRKKQKIRRQEQILAILEAANVDVSNRITKKAILKQMQIALLDPSRATKEVLAVLEAATRMKAEMANGKIRSVDTDVDRTIPESNPERTNEGNSRLTEAFMEEICDDISMVETNEAISVSSVPESNFESLRKDNDSNISKM